MREPWDQYFLGLAKAASARSSCPKCNVGCVLVKDRQVVATGYNGSISGTAHCDDVGCLIINGSCQRAEHSERAMLANAAKRGVSTENGTVYITHTPCWLCFRMLAAAGVKKIVFNEWKNNKITPEIFVLMTETAVEIVDCENRNLRDIAKVVEGRVLPE